MRHVDHAHHAEGDGEADRGQQKNRAQREPVPGVSQGVPNRKAVLDRRRGVDRRLLHRGSGARRQSSEQRERILVTALADHGNGVDLVLFRCIVAVEHDRGARVDQCPLDSRVGFLGDRLVERRQRVRILGLEHRLGRLQALARIGGHQRQAAERGFDDAAQAVVETHRREVRGRAAGHGFARCGIDQPIGSLPDENALALGAEEQSPLLQGADDLRGEGIAADSDGVDPLDGLVEAVVGETAERILVRPGAGARRQSREHAKRAHEGAHEREQARDEAIAEGTHP